MMVNSFRLLFGREVQTELGRIVSQQMCIASLGAALVCAGVAALILLPAATPSVIVLAVAAATAHAAFACSRAVRIVVGVSEVVAAMRAFCEQMDAFVAQIERSFLVPETMLS